MKFTITKVVTYNLQVRPDAPADGGEGFKRTWSEAKEEVSITFQNICLNIKAYFLLKTGRMGRRWPRQWETCWGELNLGNEIL